MVEGEDGDDGTGGAVIAEEFSTAGVDSGPVFDV